MMVIENKWLLLFLDHGDLSPKQISDVLHVGPVSSYIFQEVLILHLCFEKHQNVRKSELLKELWVPWMKESGRRGTSFFWSVIIIKGKILNDELGIVIIFSFKFTTHWHITSQIRVDWCWRLRLITLQNKISNNQCIIVQVEELKLWRLRSWRWNVVVKVGKVPLEWQPFLLLFVFLWKNKDVEWHSQRETQTNKQTNE